MWRQTPQFQKVEYRRVELASARLMPVVSEWPADTRWIAEQFPASPEGEGLRALRTPRFIVASNRQHKILYTAWGNAGWSDFIMPWLDRHVGT